MNPTQLIENLNWRYATKSFDPSKKIDPSTWSSIEDSLILTPSSFGLQPWKFIVVTDPDLKEQLLPHSWNQRQVVDCSHLVVLCALSPIQESHLEKFIEQTIAVRGGDRNSLQMYHDMMSGFIERMNDDQLMTWAKHQVYIALGQLMANAAALKIDACPMEGIIPAKYDELLGLENTDYHTTVVCPLGYRSEEDKYAALPKVRFTKSDMIAHF